MNTAYNNQDFMAIALNEAQLAKDRGEVPVGACLVSPQGKPIAWAGNNVISHCDPTAHAEMLVIRQGAQILANPRLSGCDLWVTLEPCQQCAGAIALARIRRLYFGAEDPKGGAVYHGSRFFSQPTCHHHPEILSGFYEEQAAQLLTEFFSERR